MTLAEFIALVKDEANKGDRLDSIIPTRVNMAVQRLERRYTMKYLEQQADYSLAVGDNKITLPTTGIKGINFVRYQGTSGDYEYLSQCDPKDVIRDSEMAPTGYYLVGTTELWFDNTVQEALDIQVNWSQLSATPISDDHWILANAVDCLLAETMIVMSTRAREPSWKETYGQMLQSAMEDLFRADNELRNTDRDYRMEQPGSIPDTFYRRYPGDQA